MKKEKNKQPSLDKKTTALNKMPDPDINPGEGKKISDTLRQYPKKIGKHGIDDERTLNPEE
ncbi:hypothetical protein [Pseudochryseolinea flava]|nr:hypothetical protein [Pseudochryseolinea flava]